MEKKTYNLQDGGQITADSAADFVTQLREGSRFDADKTDVEYMSAFSERFRQLSGNTVRAESPGDFLADLIAFGYVLS